VDDEGQPKEVPEGNPFLNLTNLDPLEFLPTTSTSSLELINPISWKTVDTYSLPSPSSSLTHSFPLQKYEKIMSLKQVDLQVSEESKRRRPFLAMGTATLRGEDAGTKGNLYVFDISQVVPQPGRPETNRKLRLAWQEEVRGAVTVVNEVRGYLLSSQGQKVMVRAFGEVDKEFLPVAFFDLSMVVTVAQSIRDFVLFGDIMYSICFIGFQVSPPL
jgi:cleavage and polyadenylation specificity factor subunit 1